MSASYASFCVWFQTSFKWQINDLWYKIDYSNTTMFIDYTETQPI